MIKTAVTVALAVMLVLANFAGAAAFADDTGTVTLSNAMPDTEYVLYFVFDAAYHNTTRNDKPVTYASYSIDASTEAGAALKTALEGTGSPFAITNLPGTDIYEVTEKASVLESVKIDWLKANISLFSAVGAAVKDTDLDNVIEFTGLKPGYYLLLPSTKTADGGAIISLTTSTPNAEVIDKTPRTPSNITKNVSKETAEIGETVEFSVSFNAVNFRTDTNGNTVRITDYIITDTAVNGLDFISDADDTVFGDNVDGTLKLYAKNVNGIFSDELTYTADGGDYRTPVWTYDSDTNKLSIEWGTETESYYPGNIWVVFTYSMTVNADTYKVGETGGKFFDAVNKVSGDMKLKGIDDPENFGEDTETVKNTGVSITKVDAAYQTEKLSGATFVLYKVNTTGDKLYWFWDETDDTIVWKSDIKDAAKVVADNSDVTAEFFGLASGVYFIQEVKAPDGYNLPKDVFPVYIAKSTDSDELTVTVDNTAATDGDTGIPVTVIENAFGSKLPTTGGVGTTIFYIVGGLLAVGAVALLITKKRMN